MQHSAAVSHNELSVYSCPCDTHSAAVVAGHVKDERASKIWWLLVMFLGGGVIICNTGGSASSSGSKMQEYTHMQQRWKLTADARPPSCANCFIKV